ncbi:hypothetical protein Esti_004688 [Eimeria stiedai]
MSLSLIMYCSKAGFFEGKGPRVKQCPATQVRAQYSAHFPVNQRGNESWKMHAASSGLSCQHARKTMNSPALNFGASFASTQHRLENGSCAASFSYTGDPPQAHSQLEVSSSLFTGRCDRVMSFARLSPDEKKLYERRCDMAWPCTPLCSPNYGASCPDVWGVVGDDQASCLAGPQIFAVHALPISTQYTGPCLPNMSFRKMDKSMKVRISLQAATHGDPLPCVFPLRGNMCHGLRQAMVGFV